MRCTVSREKSAGGTRKPLILLVVGLVAGCAEAGESPLAPSEPALAEVTTSSAILFSEAFSSPTGGSTGTQCETGNTVYASTAFAGWTASGTHAAHAVEWAAGSIAASFYDTNQLAMNSGIAANEAGILYTVAFRGGPAVWELCSAATAEGDGVLFEVLRPDESLLAWHMYYPPAWSGAGSTLNPAWFAYQGDGSGPIRLRLRDNASDARFGGAIGDIRIFEHLRIVSPGADATVRQGETITVEWAGGDPEWSVAVSYISAALWQVMGYALVKGPNSGSVSWTVPADLAPGTYYMYVQNYTDTGWPLSQWRYGPGFEVVASNVAPVVTSITLPPDPAPVNTEIAVSAVFTDENITDTHTALIGWGDVAETAGLVTETDGSGTVAGSYTFTAPGVYAIDVAVSDGSLTGSRSSSQDLPAYIVVYDPDGGFVTGGGWIDSPAGACLWSGCLDDGSTVGPATFGFVSKYKPGATTPSGHTEFHFKAGDLNFGSSSYQWLVVSGAKAQYKGSGQINGAGDYGFILTANDGQVSGGGGVDRFRIKIWDKATEQIVYDNQMGAGDDADPTTALARGSIVVHRD